MTSRVQRATRSLKVPSHGKKIVVSKVALASVVSCSFFRCLLLIFPPFSRRAHSRLLFYLMKAAPLAMQFSAKERGSRSPFRALVVR